MQVNSPKPPASADETSVRIPVDVRRFPWIRRLAADYAYDFRSVAPFFSGDPADRSAWADAVARAQAHDRRRRFHTGLEQRLQHADLGRPSRSPAAQHPGAPSGSKHRS